MEVVPSILENDLSSFSSTVKRLSPYFNHLQIDIADGIFVPNKTVQIEDLVFDNKNVYDFHLMVKDYESQLTKLEKIKNRVKIDKIFIHFSVLSEAFFSQQGKVGIALNPEDSVASLVKKIPVEKLPAVQIMSVHPGFQGQSFLKETLLKIEQLRNYHYRNKIYLDGAVNDKTLPEILAAGFKPDVICPGSYLTKVRDDDLKRHLQYLYSIVS